MTPRTEGREGRLVDIHLLEAKNAQICKHQELIYGEAELLLVYL